MSDPTTRSFVWHGRRLGYETFGEGDRVLVLLHGLLMDARLNRGLARALARGVELRPRPRRLVGEIERFLSEVWEAWTGPMAAAGW